MCLLMIETKMVNGVKKKTEATPSKKLNNRTETMINYIYICCLNYLKLVIQ